jgi:hypothetical protein
MGEASGSQLRIWAHRLPALVSKVGWYASLPADAVAFVRTDENEVADIQSHLRALLTDPSAFVTMGERGRRELEEKHAPARYARTVMEMAERSRDFRARTASLRLAERTGVLLSEWLAPNAIGEAGANIAKEIFEIGTMRKPTA